MRKLFAGVVIAALSLLGVSGVSLATASAHPRAVTHGANLPVDQIRLAGIICLPLETLQSDMGKAVHNYQPHRGMPEAGLWVNNQFYGGNDMPQLVHKFVCVVVTPPVTYPPGVPTPPIVTTTTTPTVSTLPSTPTTAEPSPCTGIDDCHIVCNNVPGEDSCNICIGNGDCDIIVCPVGFELLPDGDCVPVPPIVTTTTEAPTTTVPPTTTPCIVLKRVTICKNPTTTTTVEIYPTTSTTVAPTTSTTEAATTTTTEVTATTLPSEPEGPCAGFDDCHVVCHNNVSGEDDCNICIGNEDCDVLSTPSQPIVTTTTEPVTTTTAAPTTTTEPHCDKYCGKSS